MHAQVVPYAVKRKGFWSTINGYSFADKLRIIYALVVLSIIAPIVIVIGSICVVGFWDYITG